jgi:hypothetical protein
MKMPEKTKSPAERTVPSAQGTAVEPVLESGVYVD